MNWKHSWKLWAIIATILLVVGLHPAKAVAEGDSLILVTSYNVSVDWQDDDNRDGYRPGSLDFKLLANGEDAGSCTLDDENNWQYIWDWMQYEDESGRPIHYMAILQNDQDPNYTYTYQDNERGLHLICKHDIETTSAHLELNWEGDEGKDTRPQTAVSFNLLNSNDQSVDSISLNSEEGWAGAIVGLHANEGGKPINYHWEKVTIPHYTMTDTKAGTVTTRTYTYSSPVTLHFTSLDGEILDAITFDVVAPDSTTIAQAIDDYFNTTEGIDYSPFELAGYQDSGFRVTKPMSEYASYDQMNADEIKSGVYVGDGLDVYYVMLKEFEGTPEATIEAPVCGTKTTTPDGDRNKQTNPPQITTPEGVAYHPDNAKGYLPGWWRVNGEAQADIFEGTFKGGNDYYAGLWLAADYGYAFSTDDFSINGGEHIRKFEGYSVEGLYAGGVVKVTAVHVEGEPADENVEPATCTKDGSHDVVVRCVKCGDALSCETVVDPKLGHDWGDWVVTKEPAAGVAGEEARTCARCDAKETREIDPLPVEKGTLTFDLAGGTLDGKTGKVTVVANVGETIKLPGAPTREGYTFKYWKGSQYEAGAEYKVEGDHSFTAVWEKNAEKQVAKQAEVAGGRSLPKTGDVNVAMSTIVFVGFLGVASLLIATKVRPQ